jgi:hypothetical protein
VGVMTITTTNIIISIVNNIHQRHRQRQRQRQHGCVI